MLQYSSHLLFFFHPWKDFFFLCLCLIWFSFNQEPTRPAIPILLAVGAVHQHLIQNGLRISASIVADTAQCFSTHHFACLIGYGARSAFCMSVFEQKHLFKSILVLSRIIFAVLFFSYQVIMDQDNI